MFPLTAFLFFSFLYLLITSFSSSFALLSDPITIFFSFIFFNFLSFTSLPFTFLPFPFSFIFFALLYFFLQFPNVGCNIKSILSRVLIGLNSKFSFWIINDCYIFFPYLQVWVFLFLRTSFFTAQHVVPMLDQLPYQSWRDQSHYLPVAEGRIIGFIPFLRVLVLWEIQTVLSRIWI